MKDNEDKRYKNEWDEYESEIDDKIEAEFLAWSKNDFDMLLLLIMWAILFTIKPVPMAAWKTFLIPLAPFFYIMGVPIYFF